MNNLLNKGAMIYMRFMTTMYLLYFVFQGLDIELDDLTYYDNDEWLLALGLMGLLATNLIMLFMANRKTKEEVVIEEKEEDSV